MRLPAIIDDFSKGEVSPLVLARLSSAEVKNGLDLNINMHPDPHGPLVGRQGFRHLMPITCTDKHASLYEFEMYEGKTLCLIFFDNKVQIYNLSAGVVTTHLITTPYTAALLHGAANDRYNLEGVKSPDSTKIYFLHGSVAPYVMNIADLGTPSDTTLTVTFAAVSFTSMPAEWTGDNFPSTMTFHQDRTWWGGCKKNPETFWGSKSGAANHHILTLGTLADDAVKFVLQKEGLIKWLSGHSNLLIGTSWGEFVAAGSAGVIVPSDVQIDPQSAYGSRRVTPEFIGDEVLYVSADGRKLRSMWWRWIESGWKSIDLTFTSEHLTAGGIKDIAYCRDPDSQVWLLTANNTVVCCSYRRTNENDPAVGWARIELGENIGTVTGICSARMSGRSVLVVAAQVTVGGVPALHLMQQDTKDIYADELIMLDNYTLHTPGAGVKTITGLTYLEGQTVALIGDGAVLPRQTVTGGAIDTGEHYAEVYVGRKYRQKITTLPYFIYEKGLAHPMKRWNKIWCYIFNSFPPLINGKRPATRYPSTPMGQGDTPISDLVMVSSSGWDRLAKITIEQDIPKPLIILGIYGEVALETV